MNVSPCAAPEGAGKASPPKATADRAAGGAWPGLSPSWPNPNVSVYRRGPAAATGTILPNLGAFETPTSTQNNDWRPLSSVASGWGATLN